jgi:hypothetical protein
MKKKSNPTAQSKPAVTIPPPQVLGVDPRPGHNILKDPAQIDEILKAGSLQISDSKATAVAAASTSSAQSHSPESASQAGNAPSKRRVAFQFQRPARSVKIAGDFTHWTDSPVDMIAAGEGQWSAIVQLPPGEYAYRFIADGEWCEDPHCGRHTPNGFGGQNSVVVVR